MESIAGRIRTFAAAAVLAALLGPAPGRAQGGRPLLAGACATQQTGDRVNVYLTVTNGAGESVFELDPSLTPSGSASLAVSVEPRPAREVVPGRSYRFTWRARVSGSGSLDLLAVAAGTDAAGNALSTALTPCLPRITVGTNDPPRPTRTPIVKRTRLPSKTPRPTPTPLPVEQRTRKPTKTSRPTRTPYIYRTRLISRTPRPTRTPVPPEFRTTKPTKTRRPTRTPIRHRTRLITKTPRPTRTPVPIELRTRKPMKTPRPTRTPIPLELRTRKPTKTPRPTRTPIPPEQRTRKPTKTPRPTRTPVANEGGERPPTQTQRSTRTPAPKVHDVLARLTAPCDELKQLFGQIMQLGGDRLGQDKKDRLSKMSAGVETLCGKLDDLQEMAFQASRVPNQVPDTKRMFLEQIFTDAILNILTDQMEEIEQDAEKALALLRKLDGDSQDVEKEIFLQRIDALLVRIEKGLENFRKLIETLAAKVAALLARLVAPAKDLLTQILNLLGTIVEGISAVLAAAVHGVSKFFDFLGDVLKSILGFLGL